MHRPSATTLRLVTNSDEMLRQHASLRPPSQQADSGWNHIPRAVQQTPRPLSALSDSSWYTAQTSDNESSLSSRSSVSSIRVQISVPTIRLSPTLKRKTSPTELSLRELRAEQSRRDRMLQAKRSEEQLQRVYESQIQAYLDGQHADLHSIAE
ncbi:hypothetical protein LTR85_001577 [Meristemomyces frigidus]|nr:hypothetical protein LTR85_001577 [Meristemomyces frigidus]